jgi:hypothetical protein
MTVARAVLIAAVMLAIPAVQAYAWLAAVRGR